jgi:hypothetical protein
VGEETPENLLEEIIAEISKREELNNEEIARVTQQANVKIFLKLFKATDDKTVEFDVANPTKIEGPTIETEVKTENPDLSFDDSYYTIDDEKEKEINVEEIKSLIGDMEREKSDLEIKLMEKKPQLVKLIKSKLRNNNPKVVAYSIKKAGAPEELIKSASEGNLPDTSDINFLIDRDNEFLQKVASYGRIKSRYDELEERLEKAASLAVQLAKHPLKTLEVASLAGETKDKTKKHYNKIKNKKTEGDSGVRKSKFRGTRLYS